MFIAGLIYPLKKTRPHITCTGATPVVEAQVADLPQATPRGLWGLGLRFTRKLKTWDRSLRCSSSEDGLEPRTTNTRSES